MTKSAKRPKNPDTPEVKSKYYLTNEKLLPAVLRAKARGQVTEELGEMLMLISRNYAKHPFFSGWSFKEDMISEALINLCQNALKFNPEKSNNPFAFYTTCVHHSFLQFLNTERRHRNIRDKMLIELGENPSFNYLENYHEGSRNGDVGNAHAGEFREEVRELSADITEARERQKKLAEEERVRAAAKAAEEAAAVEAAAAATIVETVVEPLVEGAPLTF